MCTYISLGISGDLNMNVLLLLSWVSHEKQNSVTLISGADWEDIFIVTLSACWMSIFICLFILSIIYSSIGFLCWSEIQ